MFFWAHLLSDNSYIVTILHIYYIAQQQQQFYRIFKPVGRDLARKNICQSTASIHPSQRTNADRGQPRVHSSISGSSSFSTIDVRTLYILIHSSLLPMRGTTTQKTQMMFASYIYTQSVAHKSTSQRVCIVYTHMGPLNNACFRDEFAHPSVRPSMPSMPHPFHLREVEPCPFSITQRVECVVCLLRRPFTQEFGV